MFRCVTGVCILGNQHRAGRTGWGGLSKCGLKEGGDLVTWVVRTLGPAPLPHHRMSASHQAKDVRLGGQGDLPAPRTSPHLAYPTLYQWASPRHQRGFEIVWPRGFQIVLWRGHRPASPPATRTSPEIQIRLYHYHLNDHLHNNMFSVSLPLSRSGSGNLAMAVLSMLDPQSPAWCLTHSRHSKNICQMSKLLHG